MSPEIVVGYHEMHKFLSHAEKCLRLGDSSALLVTIFIWSQRSERILAGEETFEDQHCPEPSLGGLERKKESGVAPTLL